MSRLRITLAVTYVCLFGCAFLIGIAALKSPGGSTGFAWVALMGMPWSLLIMLLPRPPSSTAIALAQVWLLVFCPLINISLLLGLHRRRSHGGSGSDVQSGSTERARWHSLAKSLVGWCLVSMLMAIPVAAIYGFFFSLPNPVMEGERAVSLAAVRVSIPFVCMDIWMSIWPCLSVIGMGLCAPLAASCAHARAGKSLAVALLALTQFVAMAIWAKP